jgi:hypothetical protein
LPATDHEPFNGGRVFGNITQRWVDTRDNQVLDAAIEDIARTGLVIKHCVETVPWQVTESLARAASRVGYRHLVLYRRNAIDRLLSLHFAQQTGVWSSDMKQFIEVTGAKEADCGARPETVDVDTFKTRLPIEKLVHHERHCNAVLTRIWDYLQECGANPIALAYEDIYSPSGSQNLRAVLTRLEIAIDEAKIDAWITELVDKGEQGTRDQYELFVGTDELTKRLQSIPPFSAGAPGEKVSWQSFITCDPRVLYFHVDVLPRQARTGQCFEIGGVLVLNQNAPDEPNITLVGEASSIPLTSGQPSLRMAMRYPTGKNPGRSRWSGNTAFLRGMSRLRIKLTFPDGNELILGEIFLGLHHDD